MFIKSFLLLLFNQYSRKDLLEQIKSKCPGLIKAYILNKKQQYFLKLRFRFLEKCNLATLDWAVPRIEKDLKATIGIDS